MFLLHKDLPDRHQSLPRSSAETECAQRGRSGCGGLIGRRVQPVGTVPGRAVRSQSGTRFDAAGIGTKDRSGFGGADAPRADGVRVEALSWAEVAYGGRDAEHDGRDGEKYIVSRDARSEEHTSELQSRVDLVCRLLLEKKKKKNKTNKERKENIL